MNQFKNVGNHAGQNTFIAEQHIHYAYDSDTLEQLKKEMIKFIQDHYKNDFNTEKLKKEIIDSIYGGLPDTTLAKISKNQQQFLSIFREHNFQLCVQHEIEKLKTVNPKGNLLFAQNKILQNATDSLKSLESSTFLTPNFQKSYKFTIKIASESDSNILHKTLAWILHQRLYYGDNELLIVLISYALEIMDKLSISQMNFLTFLALTTWLNAMPDDHLLYQVNTIKKFTLNLTNLTHLNHLGCIRYAHIIGPDHGILGRHLANFQKKYPNTEKLNENFVNQLPPHKNVIMKDIIKILPNRYINETDLTPLGAIIADANFYANFNFYHIGLFDLLNR